MRPGTFLTLLAFIMAGLASPAKALDKAAIDAQFRQWIARDLWPEAKAAGISEPVFQKALTGATLYFDLPDLVPPGTKPPKEQAQTQAEFSSPGPYFSEKRLADLATKGRTLYEANRSTLKKVEAAYGVPGEIIIAIWGRETGYGVAKLPYPAVSVLATKAFMSTRKDMFRQELIAALAIVQKGDAAPAAMMGSWAGALGQPQFMPSSYLKYAADFDGDGHPNIWTSLPDTFASIANYLKIKGWQRGRGWAYEVTIPANVPCSLEGPDRAKPLAAWTGAGVQRINGKGFPSAEAKGDTMMLVPAGTFGPEFLVTPNFYVIKEYNNSDLYALFIGNLADRIARGDGAFTAAWGDVGKMLRSDVLAMQNRLVKLGYDVGKADGLPGFKTRRSLGEWQAKNGLAATCYPDASLKSRLK